MAAKEESDATHMKIDEKNDFGFSFADESEINEPVKKTVDSRVLALQENFDFRTKQLNDLYAAVAPLLTNLKKDPKKEYIKWPNRIEKIESFETKLHLIMTRKMEIEQ